MRAVIDTNVLLSGLIWHGTPHTLVESIRAGTLNLVTSPALITELAGVIGRPKFQKILARSGIDPVQMLADLWHSAEIVEPPALPLPVSRDPDDDAVLAVGIAAQVGLIISGDHDLLVLGHYAQIPIVSPIDALDILTSR